MELLWKSLVAAAFSLSISFAATATAKENISFTKKSISLAGKKIKVEIAETDQQHEHGLMFREKLPTNEGMLFVFKDLQIRSFWMKNTIIDLSIGYFDENKKLIDTQEMKATKSLMQQDLPAYPSKSPAMYALEMSQGWFKKNKVSVGAVFSFIK